MADKRGFGAIERLSSGRYRARYRGPDLRRHTAPITFDTKLDAEAWLVDERRLMVAGDWMPPDQRGVPQPTSDQTFGEYAATWLAERPIKIRTHERYERILRDDLLPPFGPIPMRAISPGGDQDLARQVRHVEADRSLAGLLAAAHDPRHRRHRRAAGRQPVPHPRRRQRQARAQGRAGHAGGARRDDRGHAAALPADAAAGRLVRDAVRRADRAAPQGHRPGERSGEDP